MRIISKFHDYYDVGMRYGMDKEVVYVRTTEEVPYTDRSHIQAGQYVYRYPPVLYKEYWTRLVFSVCGRFYICYSMYLPSYLQGEERRAFCYSTQEVESVLRSLFPEALNRLSNTPWRDNRTYKEILEWEFSNQGKPLPPDLHQKYKTPVFVEGCLDQSKYPQPYGLWKNPNLRKLEFFRIEKDPVRLYQDIYMFISGIIGTPENKMAKINNEERIITHGYDLKYSFRKRPK